MRHVRKECARFSEYVLASTGQDVFSEGIGAQYLSAKFGYPAFYPVKTPDQILLAVRCVRRLGEIQLFGAFRRQWSSQKETGWYLDDEKIIHAYLDGVQTADHRESTKVLRTRQIKRFYDFLGFRKLNGIVDVSPQIISDFSASIQGIAQTSAQVMMTTLKQYLRFLFKKGFCEQDWSSCVPKTSARKNQTVPALWEQDEIERVLQSVDRISPVGKRDYAILLLAVQLGLRCSDIAGLKLESLKWERNEIDLVQRKTGNRLVLPLCDDVGWAIIDYIRYARPPIESDFVFLTANAPYHNISHSTASSKLRIYAQRCGITKAHGTTKGIHSLRHGLARRLLEQGTPLAEVADILGHVGYSSTTPYLKVDIEGLRKCTLSLAEVMTIA
jgi:site-specific recombinase XerD